PRGRGQALDGLHRIKRKRPIQVREERATAGSLPSQRIAEPGRINADQDEIITTGKMTANRLLQLAGGRQMNETVAFVIGRPVVTPCRFGGPPLFGAADLVDRLHASSPLFPGTVAARTGCLNRNDG